MAPREIPLDEHGNRRAPSPPNWAALLVVAILLALAARACLPGAAPSTGEAAPTSAGVAATAMPPLQIITPTPGPGVTAGAVVPASTPAPAPPVAAAGCPDARPVPEGARVGWLARAAGCPDVLFASVNGERRWAEKPAGFPEALYSQLPELIP